MSVPSGGSAAGVRVLLTGIGPTAAAALVSEAGVGPCRISGVVDALIASGCADAVAATARAGDAATVGAGTSADGNAGAIKMLAVAGRGLAIVGTAAGIGPVASAETNGDDGAAPDKPNDSPGFMRRYGTTLTGCGVPGRGTMSVSGVNDGGNCGVGVGGGAPVEVRACDTRGSGRDAGRAAMVTAWGDAAGCAAIGSTVGDGATVVLAGGIVGRVATGVIATASAPGAIASF